MKHTKEMAVLLLAGSLFFCLGGEGRVKTGVEVEGVSVGGMSYGEATAAVREKIANTLPSLTVQTPAGEYVFAYPELSFTDNVPSLLRRAKKGERLRARVTRTWADAEERILELCERNARKEKNAELSFSSAGFSYAAEERGISCDYARLMRDVTRALAQGEDAVTLHTREVFPAVRLKDLREKTRLLSSFTTRFDGNNAPRAHNIALAAERISGAVLLPHETFSFNKAVGARTAANGFQRAAIIVNGEFVQGTGGGVCQASTTLFGAALRAGLKVTESRPHSLSVSYVPPSLDAMVSSASDLKFVNPYDFPVYLLARTGKHTVTFEIYGKPDGKTYKTESVVLFRLSPPPAQIVEGEEDRTVRAEKEGIASESYLLTYDGAVLLSRTLIRKDRYACVQGVYERKPAPEPSESSEAPPAEEKKAQSEEFAR